MLAKSEEQISNEWEKYKNFTIRPLLSTITYYHHWILSQYHTCKYALYGGTPEIRTLFQDLNKNVTIIDKSMKMVRAMGLLTSSQLPVAHNETVIVRDWLNINSFHNAFDFLIGDDAINMVAWKDFPLFLQIASHSLNPNGLFICHLLVKPDEEFIQQSFSDLIRDYQNEKIKNQYDLASRFNFICFDNETYGMGWQHTIQTLGRDKLNCDIYSNTKGINGFNFVDTFGLCNSHFHCPPQLNFEKLITEYFSIEEIFYPNEYEYCLFEPVYVLKNKKGL